jgi:hypothetical protein
MIAAAQAALVPPGPDVPPDAVLAYRLKQAGAVITALEMALISSQECHERLSRQVGGLETAVVHREAGDLARVAIELLRRWRNLNG